MEQTGLPEQIASLPRALTAKEIAVLLRVTPRTIYRMARTAAIPCIRIGTCVRFDPAAIADWLRAANAVR
jgi:excisionase family DNA binding protein